MSDAASLRALEERATPGPWTPDGDKICATAADALIPDNILVAYYTGHEHRIALMTTRPPADLEFMAAARTAMTALHARLPPLHPKRAEHHPEHYERSHTLRPPP